MLTIHELRSNITTMNGVIPLIFSVLCLRYHLQIFTIKNPKEINAGTYLRSALWFIDEQVFFEKSITIN